MQKNRVNLLAPNAKQHQISAYNQIAYRFDYFFLLDLGATKDDLLQPVTSALDGRDSIAREAASSTLPRTQRTLSRTSYHLNLGGVFRSTVRSMLTWTDTGFFPMGKAV
jgi:hypothetical protein